MSAPVASLQLAVGLGLSGSALVAFGTNSLFFTHPAARPLLMQPPPYRTPEEIVRNASLEECGEGADARTTWLEIPCDGRAIVSPPATSLSLIDPTAPTVSYVTSIQSLPETLEEDELMTPHEETNLMAPTSTKLSAHTLHAHFGFANASHFAGGQLLNADTRRMPVLLPQVPAVEQEDALREHRGVGGTSNSSLEVVSSTPWSSAPSLDVLPLLHIPTRKRNKLQPVAFNVSTAPAPVTPALAMGSVSVIVAAPFELRSSISSLDEAVGAGSIVPLEGGGGWDHVSPLHEDVSSVELASMEQPISPTSSSEMEISSQVVVLEDSASITHGIKASLNDGKQGGGDNFISDFALGGEISRSPQGEILQGNTVNGVNHLSYSERMVSDGAVYLRPETEKEEHLSTYWLEKEISRKLEAATDLMLSASDLSILAMCVAALLGAIIGYTCKSVRCNTGGRVLSDDEQEQQTISLQARLEHEVAEKKRIEKVLSDEREKLNASISECLKLKLHGEAPPVRAVSISEASCREEIEMLELALRQAEARAMAERRRASESVAAVEAAAEVRVAAAVERAVRAHQRAHEAESASADNAAKAFEALQAFAELEAEVGEEQARAEVLQAQVEEERGRAEDLQAQLSEAKSRLEDFSRSSPSVDLSPAAREWWATFGVDYEKNGLSPLPLMQLGDSPSSREVNKANGGPTFGKENVGNVEGKVGATPTRGVCSPLEESGERAGVTVASKLISALAAASPRLRWMHGGSHEVDSAISRFREIRDTSYRIEESEGSDGGSLSTDAPPRSAPSPSDHLPFPSSPELVDGGEGSPKIGQVGGLDSEIWLQLLQELALLWAGTRKLSTPHGRALKRVEVESYVPYTSPHPAHQTPPPPAGEALLTPADGGREHAKSERSLDVIETPAVRKGCTQLPPSRSSALLSYRKLPGAFLPRGFNPHSPTTLMELLSHQGIHNGVDSGAGGGGPKAEREAQEATEKEGWDGVEMTAEMVAERLGELIKSLVQALQIEPGHAMASGEREHTAPAEYVPFSVPQSSESTSQFADDMAFLSPVVQRV